jgi:hypothetical protein
MTQTLHIVRKDLRRLRWWLVAWVVLLAARALLASAGPAIARGGFAVQLVVSQLSGIVAALGVVMLALLVARLVHEEPLVGLDWFWLTRPYDRHALLSAKLFIAVVFFIALPLVGELTVMAAFGASMKDMMRASSTFLLSEALWTFALMVMAALTPSLSMFALALVGTMASIALLMMGALSVAILMDAGETPPRMDSTIADPTPAVLMTTIFLVVALFVIFYQYSRRRPARAIALAFAGLAAAVVVPGVWPWPFTGAAASAPSGWMRDAVRVKPVPDLTAPPEIADAEAYRSRGGLKRQISIPVRLTGLPPGYRVQNIFAQSRLVFPDGHLLQSAQSGGLGTPPARSQATGPHRLQGVLSDVRVLSVDEIDAVPIATLLTVTDDELARLGARPGRLTTTLYYNLLRSTVVAALPLAERASLHMDDSRIDVLGLQRRVDGCRLLVRHWRVASVLSTAPFRYYEFVLRNVSRGEAFTADSRERASASPPAIPALFMPGLSVGRDTGGFSVQYLEADYPARRPGQAARPTIDGAWLAGADLAVVETADAGWIARTVTLEDFRMKPLPVQPGP